jgi:crotonobetainyl-CoA:carnitine CoA-transferase CaiB-like acyl-CoA transferase
VSERSTDSTTPPQALADLTVVELPCLDTMPFFAAAMAGKAFADLGAEVIKVEPPTVGSAERRHGPFKDEMPDPETGGLHLYLNTNKLGITLDFEKPRGRDLLFDLLAKADIVLNPNPPAINERLEIGWRTLVKRFPRLVPVSLTFFGDDSKYRDLRGGNLVATHMGLIGHETPVNQVTDPPNEPPLKPAGRQADYVAGYTAAVAAMCAIFHRGSTGKGQHVDVSQWLAMVSMARPAIGVYTHDAPGAPYYDKLFKRYKTGLPWVYPCKDGWVSFSPTPDRFWRGTKKIMGNPEWAESEIFATLPERAKHLDAVEAGLLGWFADHGKEEIFAAAQAEHVPCFPVYSVAEVADNKQYRARGFFVEHDHPAAREVRMPGAPYHFSRTPWRLQRGAPRLGEHNREIYGERLGRSEAEIERMQGEGII